MDLNLDRERGGVLSTNLPGCGAMLLDRIAEPNRIFSRASYRKKVDDKSCSLSRSTENRLLYS